MKQPDIVHRMNAGRYRKSLISPRVISEAEMERLRKWGKKNGKQYGGRNGWRGRSRKMTTAAEAILLAIYPEAKHNFGIKTGKDCNRGEAHMYWIDLAWPERKLAVEVDGSSHKVPAQRLKDQNKDAYLRDHGWCVLRFTNKQVLYEISKVQSDIGFTITKLQTCQL